MSMTGNDAIEDLRRETLDKRADADWEQCDRQPNADSIVGNSENDILKDLERYKTILQAKIKLDVSANPEYALNIINKAIEEIKQYRNMGTVDDIFERILLSEKEHYELMKYHLVGTVEECQRYKAVSIEKTLG